ncbi:MAG: hypothetical protein M9907_18525 [Burkholderiaceae bacterium]|nr:hypothetical protein [Burkholderiaceae bacterium]
MIDDDAMLRAIRHDIRAWPGGRSIRDDYEPDVYAPTTIAVVAEACGLPADHPLLARAQTPEWSARDAEALIDLVVEQLFADARNAKDAVFEGGLAARVKRLDAVAAAARTKRARHSRMQQAVLDAAADPEVRLSDRLLARGTAAKIARRLNSKYPNITSSYVSKRIEEMHNKGLLPPQRDDD